MSNLHSFSYDYSVANGAISMAVLDTLIAKGVLTKSDARGALEWALVSLEARSNMSAVREAIDIIHEMLLKFAD